MMILDVLSGPVLALKRFLKSTSVR
jgi:hypothetical protein